MMAATQINGHIHNPFHSAERSLPWKIVLVFLAYFLSAQFCQWITISSHPSVTLWAPSGIMVAIFLRTAKKQWPYYLGAAIAANIAFDLFQHRPLAESIVFTIGNCTEAVVGAWMIRSFVSERFRLETIRELFSLLFFSAFLSTMISATAGTYAIEVLNGPIAFGETWLVWWSGDAAGVLIFAPLTIALAATPHFRWDAGVRRKILEGAGLITLIAVIISSVLWRRGTFAPSIEFLILLPLLWGAVRFGLKGTAVVNAVIACAVVWGTTHGLGPHGNIGIDMEIQVLTVQLFIGGSVFIALVLAIIFAERTRAEAALKESQLKYRIVADNTYDWEIWQALDDSFVYHSPSCKRITGYDPAAFISDPHLILSLVHPDDRDLFIEHRNTAEEGAGATIEFRIIAADGTIKWIEHVCQPIYDNDNKRLGTRGSNREVTERKRADQALQERNRLIDTVLENSPIGFAVNTIHDGAAVFVSKKFDEIYGVSVASMKSVDEFFEKVYLDPVFREEIRARILTDMASGDASRMRWENIPITTAAGEKKYITAINIPVLDQDLMVSTVQDVTQRMLAEKALLLLDTAVQSAANAIVITERDGTIIAVNEAFTRVSGYASAEVLGRKPSILKSGKQPPEFYRTLWETISSGSVWKGEIENKRRDGSSYIEEMTITPVRQAGNEITHFIGIKLDITERKKLENELFQSQKVQSIGTLAGGIAHDFNNILSIILGYTSMLEAHRADEKKFPEYIGNVTKTINRGAALVQQILTFARKTDVLFESINIPDFIRETITMLGETFPKTITFTFAADPDLPEIEGDRTQIHQVFLNLCVNARDAMPSGGTISMIVGLASVEHLRRRFPAASGEEYLAVRISDTGIGMDEATRLRVFDPFFTTKAQGKGTGLGLSVVYGVVQSHRGFIDVESEIGRGTAFNLYLPVPQKSSRAIPSAHVEDGLVRGGSETILVVEDEDLLIELICTTLEMEGYRVMTATDGLNGIGQFIRHRDEIDAVLTDIGLPVMSGIDVSRKLLEIDPAVRVMVASGFYEPGKKEELEAIGVKGFINKPYRINDVLKMVRRVLDEK